MVDQWLIGDQWGFVLRNCTSFVAWRLQERNRMAGFANDFRGAHWGDATNWDDVARELGYRVDSVPAIGAVAQTDAGRVGHVAWVSAIGPGTVTVEEYNHALPGGYGSRTLPVGTFRYLHLDDVAPSPLLGSDRSVVSVPDGLGESWTARVDAAGTLRVARPGRPAPGGREARRLLPDRGACTQRRSPRAPVGGRDHPRRTRHGRDDPRRAATPSAASARPRPTSSPALAQSRTHRPVLASTSPTGTLLTRRLTRQGRWSTPERVGQPGSWATHTAPVLGNDGTGRTWLVAVTSAGATFAQRLSADGSSV